MAQYDPSILEVYANALYRRANSIIIAWIALGLLFGIGIGFAIEANFETDNLGLIVSASAIIVGGIGYSIGNGRAFMLKLRAQELLCQRQIEANTRASASALQRS